MRWFCYPTRDEPDLWAAWLARQTGRARARHAVAMRFLAAGNWQRPHYRELTGACQGLGEIRVSAEVEWRLIGRRDTAEDSFTVLIICRHKDRNYDPRDALETAMRRWHEIENGFERKERDGPPP